MFYLGLTSPSGVLQRYGKKKRLSEGQREKRTTCGENQLMIPGPLWHITTHFTED